MLWKPLWGPTSVKSKRQSKSMHKPNLSIITAFVITFHCIFTYNSLKLQ
ncbi:hypothetical protein AHF37_08951 [Paragonimus kellicotti]|nr:hypothetical protein AHF37_08951 [Paragonimus kellicotti]